MLKVLSVEDVSQELRSAVGSSEGAILIGIDGFGASGKSTLAAGLSPFFDAAVVHMDDFYKPSFQQPATREYPGEFFDLERLQTAVLKPVRAGAAVRYQIYDWDRDVMGDWVEIAAGRPVIVEGVYSTEACLRDLYDLRIFCVAGYEVRLQRGLERDSEAARSTWEHEWMPAEQNYVDLQRPDLAADIILQGESFGDSLTFTFQETWQ